MDGDYGKVECRCIAVYSAQDLPKDELTEELALEYANHVGFMAVVPFIRQAIADLSQRVFGQTLLMPIIRRGDVWFTGAAE